MHQKCQVVFVWVMIEGVPGYAVGEVGALVGSGPDGVPVRVKRGSKVDFIDSVSVTSYQVR